MSRRLAFFLILFVVLAVAVAHIFACERPDADRQRSRYGGRAQPRLVSAGGGKAALPTGPVPVADRAREAASYTVAAASGNH